MAHRGREAKILIEAAKQKYSRAQVDLAYHYHLEDDDDNEKAEYWYLQAAEHKSALAQYTLGLLYRRGLPGEKKRDYETARVWFRLAADQGFEAAQKMLK